MLALGNAEDSKVPQAEALSIGGRRGRSHDLGGRRSGIDGDQQTLRWMVGIAGTEALVAARYMAFSTKSHVREERRENASIGCKRLDMYAVGSKKIVLLIYRAVVNSSFDLRSKTARPAKSITAL